jgi:hypothetical protein
VATPEAAGGIIYAIGGWSIDNADPALYVCSRFDIHPKGDSAVAPKVEEVRRFSARHLAFISPLVLIHLACGLVFVVGASRVAIIVFVLTAAAQLFGLTMGYHRLLSHRSFKTSRWFQVVNARGEARVITRGQRPRALHRPDRHQSRRFEAPAPR